MMKTGRKVKSFRFLNEKRYKAHSDSEIEVIVQVGGMFIMFDLRYEIYWNSQIKTDLV
jgi:hypothetical protein